MNDHRNWREIEGNLFLLKATTKGGYELLREVADDWSAWPVRENEEERTAFTVEAQIEESGDAQLDAAVGAAFDAATDFAFEGAVYKVERDHSRRIFVSPKRWALRGYVTKGRWPPVG